MVEPSPGLQVKEAHSIDAPSEGIKEQNTTPVTLERNSEQVQKQRLGCPVCRMCELIQEYDILSRLCIG